jgi:NitT/TauT family transport system substrate-binding protein
MLLRLMPTRHSPFYTPFLALHVAGFLRREGIDSSLRIPAEGESTGAALRRGDVDVIQSAVSAAWTELDKGNSNFPVHFAQINQRDGFFIVGRKPEPDFKWSNLEGKLLLADHGHQPMVMLKWAAHNKGAAWDRIYVTNAGSPAAMEAAFRSGQGDYVHLQGGVPQQLEHEGAGYVVASAGEGLKALAFSSIAAPRAFVDGDQREPFLRAFANAKKWSQETEPVEVARVISPLFPSLAPEAISSTVAALQRIGCWEGSPRIPQDAYDEAQRVFLWAKGIQRAHEYRDVCHVFGDVRKDQ